MSTGSGFAQDTNDNTTQNFLILSGFALGSIVVLITIALFCKRFCCRCWYQNSAVVAATPNLQNHDQYGLSPSIIANLPTFEYKRHGDDVGGGDGLLQCAVCLSMVQEGEEVRQLPACKHLFHPACIDMWFYSHSTCPLCRSKVEAVEEVKVRDGGNNISSPVPPV